MKRFISNSLAIAILAAVFYSCDSSNKKPILKESMGRINQVTVFAEKDFYNEHLVPVLMDTLTFGRAYEGIYFPPELSFFPRQFPLSLYKKYNNLRNIIYIKEGAPDIEFHSDTLAKPQGFVTISGKNPADYERIIHEYADSMLQFFRSKDHAFLIREFKEQGAKYGTPEMEKVGFKLLLPNIYQLVESQDDFVWYRADYPPDILNIMVYKAPLKDSMQLNDILELRDLKLKQYTKGSKSKDHVQTERLFETFVSDSTRTARGLELTLRGNWSMAFDQMGGPSVMKVFMNEQTKQIWVVDAFIYAPLKHNKSKKRDYLTQIESLLTTFEFVE